MASRSRRPVSFKLVASGLVAVMLGVVLFGTYVYFRHVRYDPVVAFHMPAGASAALRVEVERILLFEPVRRRLFPLLSQLGARPDLQPRLQRVERRAGLRLGVDLREVLVARGPAPADWVVVLGGVFPQAGLMPAVREALQAEGVALRTDASGALVAAGGWSIGQTQDGAIVLASNLARLKAAWGRSDAMQQLGLPVTGAGGFVLAARDLADVGGPLGAPAVIDSVERLRGSFSLGDALGVDLALRLRPGQSAAPVTTALARAFPSASPAVETGAGELRSRVTLSSDELDRIAAGLGERLLRAYP
jgi:hypothetical protein